MGERRLIWEGSSLKDLRSFSDEVQDEMGYQLERVQSYREPMDWKSMSSAGKGVREIRVSTGGRAYRSMYVVIDGDTVHVLHVFEKKTRRTAKRDLDLARKHFKGICA